MSKDPAFLFYSKDWLEGTAEMTPQEKGVYIDLLCFHHQRGALPNNLKKLSRLVGLSQEEFEPIWQELKTKFEENGDQLVNHRLNQEMTKRSARGLKNMVNGILPRAVEKFYLKTKDRQKVYKAFKESVDYEEFRELDKEDVNKKVNQKVEHLVNEMVNQMGDYYENEGADENENANRNTFLTEEELGQLKQVWLDYLQHRRELKVKKYASRKSELKGFKNLLEYSKKDPEKAQEIVDQSRANGWQGLFPLKETKTRSKITLKEQTYMGKTPQQRARDHTHPVKMWGNDGSLKVCNQPGEAPKKVEQ